MNLEFRLSQADMLALMTIAQTSVLPGLDNNRLIPDEQSRQRELAEQGLENLKEQGYLRLKEDETYILDGNLGAMAITMAYPNVITVVSRDIPGEGRQQFLHYRADPVNFELTMPSETEYRLAAMPDAIVALDRVRRLLPVLNQDITLTASVEISQSDFFRIKTMAEEGQVEAAVQDLQTLGAATDAAQALVTTLQNPELGGTITFFRLNDQVVIDARDIAMVQANNVAWLIQQRTAGQETFVVQTVNAQQYSQAIVNTLTDLLEDSSDQQ